MWYKFIFLMKTPLCKKSLWWWKFTIMMKMNCCGIIFNCNLASSIWWILLPVEIWNCDKNSSLSWKKIIMVKIHDLDTIWLWFKLPKGWEFHDWENDSWYDNCYLLGSSWCNPNMMNNYWLDKNSPVWGKFMLSKLDLRSTLQTNELCFRVQ